MKLKDIAADLIQKAKILFVDLLSNNDWNNNNCRGYNDNILFNYTIKEKKWKISLLKKK